MVSEQQKLDGGEQPAEARDEPTARLLRMAGMRTEVPSDAKQRVRVAVLDEIRAVKRTRRVRGRIIVAGTLVAAAAMIALAVRVQPPTPSAPAPTGSTAIAAVERVAGRGVVRRAAGDTAPEAIGVGGRLAIGDLIETGEGRLAIRWSSGASVRIDRGAGVRLVSATTLDLAEGAVYIDSGSGTASLEVSTPLGVVRDVGTQFETRLEHGGLRVRVRSGLVEVQGSGATSSAGPGSEIRVDAAGITTRTVSPFGPDWEWTTELAPRFEVDGRTLASYLEHVSHEQGWTVTFADANLAREVSGIVVHGSVDGLSATEALSVVLSTSGLAFRLDGGRLVVSRTGSP